MSFPAIELFVEETVTATIPKKPTYQKTEKGITQFCETVDQSYTMKTVGLTEDVQVFFKMAYAKMHLSPKPKRCFIKMSFV